MFWLLLLVTVPVVYIVLRYIWEMFRIGDYSSKAVLITGCDSGFGRELAVRCITEGFTVFAGCLTDEGKRSLEEECLSSKLHAIPLDVTSDESVRKAREQVASRLKGELQLWAVVNNAGVFSCFGPDDWTTVGDYLEAVQVNTFGVIRVTQAFKRYVKRSKGRIITVTSVNGRLASPGAGPYVVSKFGTEAYMDSIRQELYDIGVKVSILEPGIFRTALLDEQAMLNRVESVWSKLDEETKEEYGEEFKNYFGKMWNERYCSMSSTKTHYVVDNYIHALTAKYPRHRYYCGWDAILIFIPLSMMPTWWSDFVIRFIGRQDVKIAAVEQQLKKAD
ncbi:oxidoreductase, short chain dehydrogenase/reductase family protein [Dictyocaulus viviparus]|uniref:Oxidoreductase, short chain dehydrogenase/reductase family protein n=1 Tax=Dictyocaulus viviparus TaxID=29172 RepID=A0A0D8YC31_DICVI|nr:oxidoreductase, short chain dehydrogenase/reductase family protein [Dictyocaulus viviparus]